MFKPTENNITSGCLDGEVKIWDKCYSIEKTDSINFNNRPSLTILRKQLILGTN